MLRLVFAGAVMSVVGNAIADPGRISMVRDNAAVFEVEGIVRCVPACPGRRHAIVKLTDVSLATRSGIAAPGKRYAMGEPERVSLEREFEFRREYWWGVETFVGEVEQKQILDVSVEVRGCDPKLQTIDLDSLSMKAGVYAVDVGDVAVACPRDADRVPMP